MLTKKMMVAGWVVLLLCGVASGAVAADEAKPRAPWHSGNYWGLGAQVSPPRNDFADKYSTGYGLQGMYNYPLIPLLEVSASVGWNHFPQEADGAGIDIWETSLGARFALGAFFMSGEMGYFSKVDEWSYMPGLGLRYDHWEFSLRVKAVGSNSWSGLRVGYYF